MANYLTTDTELTSVANAIRAKSGGSSPLEFPDGFVSEIGAIPSGGGSGLALKDVNFFDYDGTIVAAYSAADFANLSALPENPSHDGLTAQGWNWTLSDAKTYAAVHGMLDIGQMYITDDGKTRLYISIATNGRMTIPLYWSQTVANGVTIDWGDGSTVETFSGTGNKDTTHTYTAIGDYTITLDPADGCTLGLGNNDAVKGTFGGGDYGLGYTSILSKVEIGKNLTTLGSYSFFKHFGLSKITIPQGVTNVGESAFSGCYSLRFISLPSDLIYIYTGALRSLSTLQFVSIPISVTSIEANAFAYCYNLKRITLPENIVLVGQGAFSYCQTLGHVVMSKSVSQIKSSTFSFDYFVKTYDFTSYTSIPSLANIDAFTSNATDYVIFVPASLYNTWIATTNWVSIKSHIQSA